MTTNEFYNLLDKCETISSTDICRMFFGVYDSGNLLGIERELISEYVIGQLKYKGYILYAPEWYAENLKRKQLLLAHINAIDVATSPLYKAINGSQNA